jgi:hypothetical protein
MIQPLDTNWVLVLSAVGVFVCLIFSIIWQLCHKRKKDFKNE